MTVDGASVSLSPRSRLPAIDSMDFSAGRSTTE
jgi:hypothetical protein